MADRVSTSRAREIGATNKAGMLNVFCSHVFSFVSGVPHLGQSRLAAGTAAESHVPRPRPSHITHAFRRGIQSLSGCVKPSPQSAMAPAASRFHVGSSYVVRVDGISLRPV